MPELPEVETIRSELTPLLSGRTLRKVAVHDETAVAAPSVADFRRGLEGRRVVGMGRRGKFLIFKLDNGRSLLAHLRMTGNLLALGKGDLLPRQLRTARLRVQFELDGGNTLSFVDRRRMGRMWLVDKEDDVVGRLGPEPLSDEFTVDALAALLSKRKAPIKAVLCNQEVIAGIGNMYADEALFEARINPLTPARDLSASQVQRLHAAIRSILAAAIVNKGASVDTYFRPDGKQGAAHYEFKVAHRLGEPCPGCDGRVERIKLRGRGTYYCPRCQKPRLLRR